jgi:hypothetical protein
MLKALALGMVLAAAAVLMRYILRTADPDASVYARPDLV